MDEMTDHAPDAIVTITDLAFSYGGAVGSEPVLEGLSLSVPRGGFVAVVGSSGVGKSTLVRVVAGLIPPNRGLVRIAADGTSGRRAASLVFQDARLLPWRRVLGNVEFGLEGLGIGKAARRERALQALAIVGLSGQIDKWPHQLSGGQQQRAGIARALAVEPTLLLMDEPFSAVDAVTRRSLQDELLSIWQRSHASILFVTHDLDEAVYLADRIVLVAGRPARLVEDRSVDLPRPRDRSAGAFSLAVNSVRKVLEERFVEGAGI
jgi:NitT/TauT family transport system ATP-binding protein